MNSVKISIIVPAYNVGKWISKTIESVLNQTYSNWELIVINDGSTDNTGAIIDLYAQKDNRIKAVHQPNAGLISVRETGVLLATGDYIGFIDGDDAIDTDMYQRLLDNAIKYNADISHCGLRMCKLDGSVEMHYGTKKLLIHNSIEGVRELLSGEYIEPSLCNKIYKREIMYNSCLDTDVVNGEDLLRNFVLFSRAQKIVYEDFCGYQYWTRENSMSGGGNAVTKAKHVLSARKRILENSNEDQKKFAMKLWVSTLVNVANSFAFSNDNEEIQMYKDCRKLLIQHRDSIGLLIKRQQIAAWMIIISPLLHKLAYKIYNTQR